MPFEEVDIEKLIEHQTNISDIVSDVKFDDDIVEEDIVDDGNKIKESNNDNKKEDIVDDDKQSENKKGNYSIEYLKEIINNFLRHYKRQIFVQRKKDGKSVIVADDVIWYERKLVEIHMGKIVPLLMVDVKTILEYQEKIMDKDSISHMLYMIGNHPYKTRDIFTECVRSIYLEKYPNEEESIAYKTLQVGFSNFQEKQTSLTEIRSQILSKYITTEGVVSQYDEQSHVRLIESVWICDDCDRVYTQKGGKKPQKCINKECTSRSFHNEYGKNKTDDFMYIRITQQVNTFSRNNTVDRYVKVCGTALVNHVTKNISPGQVVIINGAVVLEEKLNPKDSDDIADIEIDAFTVEPKNNVNIFEYDERFLNIVKEYVNEQNIHLHVAKMKRSICAHLYKQDAMKEAVLLQLVGTNPRIRQQDGTRIKGDINILNVGNSSAGKSDYSIYIMAVMPLSVLAGTKGSTTVAGLTSYVDTNPKTGKSTLNPGVLALANGNGVAIIEEINRRNKTDMYEFTTATDDNQVIIINKGGFHTIIHTKCPIYATANSLHHNGVWDDSQTISKQTGIDSYVLSRMDLIFVTRVEKDVAYKKKLMAHIKSQYSKTVLEKEYEASLINKNDKQRTENILKEVEVSLRRGDFTGIYPIEYMRHELYYLKTIDCKLTENSEAYQKLDEFWSEYSGTSVTSLTMDDGVNNQQQHHDAMDVRKFNSLLKMTEAYGRLHRCTTPKPEHAQMAIDLMSLSLASQIPKINGLSIEEQNDYAKKMMDRQTAKRMALTLTREKQLLRQKAYLNFSKILTKFNGILHRQGYTNCSTCHGTGETSEMVDSETKKIEIYECGSCQGRGGDYVPFSLNDFIDNVIGNKILEKPNQVMVYFNIYKSKNFVYSTGPYSYKLNINLKSPDVIDAIKRIADNMADAYMEKRENDEMIKNMNNRISGSSGPVPASTILRQQ